VTRQDLLHLVEQAFPFVPRPPESEISFHADECAHCEMSRAGLLQYPGTATQLPEAAIRFVYDEWSTLSAKAATWILPSYLRYVLTDENERDPLPTEFLIYHLRVRSEDVHETRVRFSLLTSGQVAVLRAMLEYWKNDAYWSEYCLKDINAAIAFVSTLE
jgi:hypothetical protein